MFVYFSLAVFALTNLEAGKEKGVLVTPPVQESMLWVTITSKKDRGSITLPLKLLKNPNVSGYFEQAFEEESEERAAKVTPETEIEHLSGETLKTLRPILLQIHALLPVTRKWADMSAQEQMAATELVLKATRNVPENKLVELLNAANYLDAQPLLHALAWRYAELLHQHPNLITETIKKDGINRNFLPLISRQYFLRYDFDIDQQLGLKKATVIPMDVLIAHNKIPAVVFTRFPQDELAKDINMLLDHRNEKFSALSTIITTTVFRDLTLPERTNTVRALVKGGVDVNNPKETDFPLIHALRNPQLSGIATMLIHAGAHVNVSDKNGFTPLRLAAVQINEPVTRLLLSKGATVVDQAIIDDMLYRNDIFNPKAAAPRILQLLLKHGGQIPGNHTMAFLFAMNIMPSVIDEIIKKSDKPYMTQFLFMLLHYGDPISIDIMKKLLEAGVDVNAVDTVYSGHLSLRPLQFALTRLKLPETSEIVQLLKKHGAK